VARLRAIGLMSGTSMDGVDVAMIETDGVSDIAPGPSQEYPYGEADRLLLRAALADAVALSDRRSRPGRLEAAETLVTERHVSAVRAFLDANNLTAADIDVVGFHGQTVLHRPQDRLTVQIGNGSGLAEAIGIPVVHDMRAADVAAGGQGAPLVPVFHRALVEATGSDEPVAVLNLGGVGNVTFVAPGRPPIALDTGPGNALLDDFMLERTGAAMDRDGVRALAGKVDAAILAALLDHPYFAEAPPKSLDRNAFSRDLVARLSTEDGAATLCAFTAEAAARALQWSAATPTRWVVCGGGARNPALLTALRNRVNATVLTAEAMGWSSGMMEAQAFAYLAVRAYRGLSLTFPTTTGAPQPLTGGVISVPAVRRQR
jgi:anhydro-N-acetylmuramic acid kinase